MSDTSICHQCCIRCPAGKRSADKAGLDDFDVKPEPTQATAPTAEAGNSGLSASAQLPVALPSTQQIPIAPGGLSIQPLNAHMAIDGSMADTAGPNYRSQVMMCAPMQPHQMPPMPMPAILTASLNAALQPNSMQSLLHGEEPVASQPIMQPPPNPQ